MSHSHELLPSSENQQECEFCFTTNSDDGNEEGECNDSDSDGWKLAIRRVVNDER